MILFGNTDTLLESVEGQILPRIWTQGNTKCVVCKPNNELLIALFYENSMDAKENYFYAKELDSLLKDIIKYVQSGITYNWDSDKKENELS